MNVEKINAFTTAWAPKMLSVLRIMTGLLYMQHGLQKWFGFPALAGAPASPPINVFSLRGGLAGTLELVGGALIALGLLTRPVAFILAGEMAFAYFMAHSPRSFFPVLNGGNLPIMYCFVFLYFAFVGGGAWSLDEMRRRNATPAG